VVGNRFFYFCFTKGLAAMANELVPYQERIRKAYLNGRWYFSLHDIMALLTDEDATLYWRKVKGRLKRQGATETLNRVIQLQMRSADGEMCVTDAADTQALLRIIQSIPSPKAEPFKRWLAQVGTERLQTGAQREIVGFKPNESWRNSNAMMELAITGFAEATAEALHQTHGSQNFAMLEQDRRDADEIAEGVRRQIGH
jgi:prophage antirepressor-like protein